LIKKNIVFEIDQFLFPLFETAYIVVVNIERSREIEGAVRGFACQGEK
jgi:ureidoglycolate hydrolase